MDEAEEADVRYCVCCREAELLLPHNEETRYCDDCLWEYMAVYYNQKEGMDRARKRIRKGQGAARLRKGWRRAKHRRPFTINNVLDRLEERVEADQ